MYYPCSENKGADQLLGYRKADLHLCFRIFKNPVFSRRGSFLGNLFTDPVSKKMDVKESQPTKKLIQRKLWPHTCTQYLYKTVHYYTILDYKQGSKMDPKKMYISFRKMGVCEPQLSIRLQKLVVDRVRLTGPEVYLSITLTLGSIEKASVISETVL